MNESERDFDLNLMQKVQKQKREREREVKRQEDARNGRNDKRIRLINNLTF
jgi:hypothetical protein